MNEFLKKRSYPLVMAHRGSSAEAPENTLMAFDLAAKQKADAIELDVQLTKDKQIIVMHDPTVNRTTSGKGRVSRMTVNQIKKLSAGKSQKVPTLDEVLNAVADRLLVNIELKNYTTPFDGLEKYVADLIKRKNLSRRVMVCSFNPFTLRRFKVALPNVPACVLYLRPVNFFTRGRFGSRFEVFGPRHSIISKRLINRLHQKNKLVNAWTVNDKEDLRRMIDCGADIITTNHPAHLVSLLN